ncbi:hypothetical protein I6E29_08410 [Arcanobacterium haemolyticum]|nr:hypothetical protein [Arcanobacterium haemolyticum]
MNVRKAIALFAIPAAALSLAACGSDKPDIKDVEAGLTKQLTSVLGEETDLGDADISGYTSCVAKEIYDKVSADTLKVIAAADPNAELSQDDTTAMMDASTACASALAEAFGVTDLPTE